MATFTRSINMLGDIFCDIMASNINDQLPKWGQDTLGNVCILPGGSALNSAIHASTYADYLSISSTLVIRMFSAIGLDVQGNICETSLQQRNIITSNIVKNSGIRTASCIVLSGSNDRGFVSDRGCLSDMSISWFNRHDLLSTSHIHMGGFYNCPKMKEELPSLFRDAISNNVTTSLTSQFDASGRWDGIFEVCPYCTFLICNELEVRAMGKEKTLKETVIRMVELGCKYVVVTKGKDGAMVYWREEGSTELRSHHEPIQVTVRLVDTTGAGDAFVGGFLVEWVASMDVTKAMRAGCLAGTAAVTLLGGSTSSVESLRTVVGSNESESGVA